MAGGDAGREDPETAVTLNRRLFIDLSLRLCELTSIRLVAVSGALATAMLTSRPIGPISAQSLAAPTFTAAQQNAGDAIYKESCASCHGKNLDDGEFGPPLKGVEFRSAWFGRPAGVLFTTIETMPPAAPGSLGAEKNANLLAYLMSQNQLIASTRALPADLDRLQGMLLPGATGGPSGGLSPNAVLPPPPHVVNPLDRYTSVTDAMLQNPPAGEWPSWRRGYDGQGFSPLRQITKTNVRDLRAAWSWALPNGPNEIHRCFTTACCSSTHTATRFRRSTLRQAISCGSTSRRLPSGTPLSVKRAIALYGDKVYSGTSDTHVVALDARTGRVVWDTPIADAKQGYGLTGGVTVAKGKVIATTTGRAPGGNYIVALDAETGREAWRFGTIPKDGEFGGNTWNNMPYGKRNGGSVWVPGSYDSTTGLLYIGVGQTYDTGPYRDPVAGANDDLLFTDSTLALDPDTGKLAWHFQHLSNDQWDYDWAFTRTLVRLTPGGKLLVGTGGKQAVYDYLDARTGEYAFSFDLGVQNVITGIDTKTGAKQIDARLTPGNGQTVMTCPHAGGSKNWLPDSYNPDSHVLFVSLVEACMDLLPVAPGGRGSLSTGVRWALRPRPDSDGKYGRVHAIDIETKKTCGWRVSERRCRPACWPPRAASCSRAPSTAGSRRMTMRPDMSSGIRV